jgi:DNA primase
MKKIFKINNIEEFLQQNKHIIKQNNRIKVCCPYCLENCGKEDIKYKMGLNKIKKVAHCFRCGAIIFFEQSESQELQFKELEQLKEKINNLSKPIKKIENKIDTKYKIDLNKIAEIINYNKTPNAYNYLIKRGINDNQIKNLKIMVGKSEKYKGFIIFPFFNNNNEVEYFIARNYNGENPKYLNLKKDKENIIYKVGEKQDQAILCEGIFSAISANKYTNIHSIAILGKELLPSQLNTIKYNYKSIIYSLDGDVGINQKMKIINQLISANLKVYCIDLPINKDPDDLKEEYLNYFNNKKLIF